MDILERIQEMQEKIQELNEPFNCVIMHMSTAEKLLECFLGIECVIDPICPKENIYMSRRSTSNASNRDQDR